MGYVRGVQGVYRLLAASAAAETSSAETVQVRSVSRRNYKLDRAHLTIDLHPEPYAFWNEVTAMSAYNQGS